MIEAYEAIQSQRRKNINVRRRKSRAPPNKGRVEDEIMKRAKGDDFSLIKNAQNDTMKNRCKRILLHAQSTLKEYQIA